MPALTLTPSSSSSASERVSGDDEENPEDAVSDRTLGAGDASSCFNWSLRTLTVPRCVSRRAKSRGPL